MVPLWGRDPNDLRKKGSVDTMFVEVETINDEGHMVEVENIINRYKDELKLVRVECNINYKDIGKDDDRVNKTLNGDDGEVIGDQTIFRFGNNDNFEFKFNSEQITKVYTRGDSDNKIYSDVVLLINSKSEVDSANTKMISKLKHDSDNDKTINKVCSSVAS